MKNIFIAASPNIQKDDIGLIFKNLFQPWKWKKAESTREFEKEFEDYMNNGNGEFKALAFDSARSCFFLYLKAVGIGKGDEVIMPSFTCVVIVNSVLATGAKPVYVDTDPKTFNIDLDKLKEKVNEKTKAILVQHTFGIPVDVEKVRELVGENVKIIEDTAHILGGKTRDGRKFGVLGDASVHTFGIEKMMTTMRGGMVLVKDERVYESLKNKQAGLPNFSSLRIFVWLLNPIIWAIATPLYYVGIGKLTIGRIISKIGHKIGAMGNMVEDCEYGGCWPEWMPAKMPGVLATVGRNQLKKLDMFNEHRKRIAKIYDKELGLEFSKISGYTPLRYPILVENPREAQKALKKEHVILGNWYNKILFTDEKYLNELGFDKQKYPDVQMLAKKIINLPTFVGVDENDASMIAQKVLNYL